MAMFEFKDSEDIKASGCTTTSDSLIKGERLKRVEAEDCHAGVGSAPNVAGESSSWVKIRSWVFENSIKAIFAVLGSVIGAAAIAYFNLKK